MQRLPIYLDYQSTTPCDFRVDEALAEMGWDIGFGNPHSTDNFYGCRASKAVREARSRISEFLRADNEEIVFTSGATESCNLAIRGAARGATDRNEIVTLNTEHPAVLETVRALGKDGRTVHIVPVNRDGIVDLDRLAQTITNRTVMVSVMLVNNEIGVLQPVEDISTMAHRHGALMHTDASQAAGRLSIDVEKLDVDLLTFSSHKMYGPQGVGCLYVRNEIREEIVPLAMGGGQEAGLRPGTVPVAPVVGFGIACEIAMQETGSDINRIGRLSSMFWDGLQKICPEIRLHGHPNHRVVGNLNIAFPGFSGNEIVTLLQDKLALSTGSACSSWGTDPSHVVSALGLLPEQALQAIRISLGRFTTEEEIEFAITCFHEMLGVPAGHNPAPREKTETMEMCS